MAVETELKLRITPEHLARLRRHVLLRECQISRPTTHHLYNIYFDTDKRDLYHCAMTLRLRKVGGNWLQTLKRSGTVKAGLHHREECEIPVDRAVLDFSSSQFTECIPYLPPLKKLQPIFITDYFRTSRMVSWQGAVIELSMDQGSVYLDNFNRESNNYLFCEIELELKSGETAPLFDLALSLLKIAPFEVEQVSKPERGYRLLQGYAEVPIKGEMPELVGNSSLAHALSTLIWSCIQHLQANLNGLMTDDNTEYLHQVRVALRRLRVVMRLTEKYRTDDTLSGLYQEVSELCIALGRVREWDVFISNKLQPLVEQRSSEVGLPILLEVSRQIVGDYYKELRSSTQAHDWQSLLLRLGLWMNGGYWQQNVSAKTLQEFADFHLRKLAKRYRLSSQNPSKLEDNQLHEIRILAKKLRYSAEFFASLYDKKAAKSYIAALSEVQEVLGLFNDVVVSQQLLEALARRPELANHQEAVEQVKDSIAYSRSSQLAALKRAMRNFDKQSPFWMHY